MVIVRLLAAGVTRAVQAYNDRKSTSSDEEYNGEPVGNGTGHQGW